MFRSLKKYFPIIIFIAIISLAAFLRLYRLENVPPGVNRDEASIGYTAYSLLKTGKDEYGRLLPLSFQSFGDWKLPLYIYLTVPMVKIFGLTEVSVRLVSSVAGILTVGLTFFLIRLLFKNTTLALLGMAVTAIAPWNLHLSRVESESNLAVFLTTLATYLFFKAAGKKTWLYLTSFILLALTYFTYAGNHIFTTLLVFTILFLFPKIIFSNKPATIGVAVFTVMALFIFSETLFGADKTKISGISIFSNPFMVYERIELPRFTHDNPNSLTAKFFHNRLIYGLETVSQNYLKSFSPEFLAISGGINHAHNIQNFGNIYLVEYPFLILGFGYLLTKLKDPKYKLLLFWLLISPVAASITKDAPHTNRMFAIFPVLPLTIAYGIYWLMHQVKNNRKLFTGLVFIISLSYLLNLGIYLDRYYIHFPKNETGYWGQDYKNLTKILTSEINSTKRVVIANPEQSPYIFLLFYTGFNPSLYQKTAVRYPATTDGFYHVQSFGRFEFRPINWSADPDINTILIDDQTNIPVALKNNAFKVGKFGVLGIQ